MGGSRRKPTSEQQKEGIAGIGVEHPCDRNPEHPHRPGVVQGLFLTFVTARRTAAMTPRRERSKT